MDSVAANSFDLPARNLKSAIQFLRRLDVPASRIASVLNETADNIRHLDSRSYEAEEKVSLPVPVGDLATVYLDDPDHWAVLRNKQQPEVYGQSKHRLDA